MIGRKVATGGAEKVMLGRDYFVCGSGGRGYCLASNQDDCPYRHGASQMEIRQHCPFFFKVLLDENGQILVVKEDAKA
ncbi:hypothetical protein ES703_88768 [subsurface metagenome]